MHIFGNPLLIPVVLVERHVLNVPLHATDKKLVANPHAHNEVSTASEDFGAKPVLKSLDATLPRSNRVLKVVVFVHGFQVSRFVHE